MKRQIIVPEETTKGHTRREFLKYLELAGISVLVGGSGLLTACQKDSSKLADAKEIITRCGFCGEDCGMKAYIKDNVITAVAPWEEDPVGKGFLCDMGLATPELVHSPDRILNPLKRVGENFVEISWNEALDTIVQKLKIYQSAPGPESVIFHYGVSQVRESFYRLFLRRFCNVYGSPNFTGCGSQCYVAGAMAKKYTIGSFIEDYKNAKMIIQWGCNPATSSMPEWINRVLPAKEAGAKLICIDPRPGAMTSVADLHIKPIPGTDGALALAMADVIIKEGLYGREFVEKYGIGFEEYKKLVSEYPLEKSEQITGVPADVIKTLAVEYASIGPACISTGNGLELHLNGVQTIRSIHLLQALTGNIDVKGGVLMPERKAKLTDMEAMDLIHADAPGITTESYPFLWKYRKMITANKLPEAILTEKPYPIKALIVVGGNPLSTGPNVFHQKEAFEKLDFMVVMDLFMTDTAKMADIVLPGTTYMEHDSFKAKDNFYITPGVIPALGQAWPTYKFWFELAKKMGYSKEFPWNSIDEAINEYIKSANVTAADLRKNFNGIEYSGGPGEYKKYEKRGIDTPSKKIEFASPTLEESGINPLPVYENPYETENNKSIRSQYPFIATSGGRIKYFYHSQQRNIPSLLKKFPEPVIELNPEDAKAKGIGEGDLVRVSSPRGSISAKVVLIDSLGKGVVGITHGWPQSNANLLTDDEYLDPISGFPAYRGFLCAVEKA